MSGASSPSTRRRYDGTPVGVERPSWTLPWATASPHSRCPGNRGGIKVPTTALTLERPRDTWWSGSGVSSGAGLRNCLRLPTPRSQSLLCMACSRRH